MRIVTRNVLFVVVALAPVAALAQSGSSKPATYITKEEVDIVNKQPGGDRQIKVVDIGSENFAVGIVHRGPTGAPAARGAGGGRRARTLRLRNRAGNALRLRLQLAVPTVLPTTSRPRATTSFPVEERW